MILEYDILHSGVTERHVCSIKLTNEWKGQDVSKRKVRNRFKRSLGFCDWSDTGVRKAKKSKNKFEVAGLGNSSW